MPLRFVWGVKGQFLVGVRTGDAGYPEAVNWVHSGARERALENGRPQHSLPAPELPQTEGNEAEWRSARS